MTIKDCPVCGGTHYGSIKCPHDGPPNVNPDDICVCGDRRDQHVDGIGPCRLNGLGHGMGSPSNGECHGFQFSRYTPRSLTGEEVEIMDKALMASSEFLYTIK